MVEWDGKLARTIESNWSFLSYANFPEQDAVNFPRDFLPAGPHLKPEFLDYV